LTAVLASTNQADNLIVSIKYLPRVIVAAAIAASLLSWILENVDQRGSQTPEWFWFFFALVFSTTAIGVTAAGLLERLVVRWTKSRRRHSRHSHNRPVLH